MFSTFQSRTRVILAYVLSTMMVASAQNPGSITYNRTQALDDSQSQAQKVADDTVSLSAEKIIALLQREPGLLLEFKKLLVKKAFEQGRLLDSRDLTDDALFRLVTEDETVRIMATQEIERRSYIRAMPTKEEMERDRLLGAAPQTYMAAAPSTGSSTQSGNQASSQLQGLSREDLYWQQRARMQAMPPSTYPPAQMQVPAPSNPGQESPAQDQEVRTLLRAQRRTQDAAPDADSGDVQMPRVRPEDLPELLRASQQSPGAAPLAAPAAPSKSNFLNQPSLPDYQDDTQANTQRASLDAGNGTKLPPNYSGTRQDRAPLKRRVNPYADVPSLYDLYAQYGRRSPTLVRFGQDIFENGTGNSEQLPMDIPAGPDYVVGPGDGLNIELWGSVSQRLHRVVDREGRIALPEVGFLQVTGKNIGDVQRIVQATLREQFRDVQADISLARLRTVRVYVVGDVQRAGAYDVSSLSTPLNAVFAAGGPTARGSLRVVRHLRGNEVVQEVDVYDLLLHGMRTDLQHLQSGDTVLVPPLGPEVTVEGMVRRPAIYEIHGEKNLAEVLELAGGVLTSGTLRHVDVERVQAHESRTMLRLDLAEGSQDSAVQMLENFQVQDGDRVKISPILPFADKTVFLDGHVFRPGKYAYRDGMTVADLIGSYNDLLPEPSKQHAEIIRLAPPDYTPQVVAFNLGDALANKANAVALKPFDTVRIFSRFDFEDPPIITISGEVRDPGDHLTNGATRVRDAVFLAGGVTPYAADDSAQILRRTSDNELHVLSINLAGAIAGNEKDNIVLFNKDQLLIHRNLAKVDPPTVLIEGEVARPGKYPLGSEMTAAQLVRTAGGFKRGAYTDTADLTRYSIEHGEGVVGEHSTVQIASAMAGEPDTDVRLHAGDVLTIKQIAGWRDIGATIKVGGEVVHPGTYGIRDGERLSSILQRAGGLRSTAYPYGTIFERVTVREIAERTRADLMNRIQNEGASLKLIPDGDAEQRLAKSAALMQWQTTVEQLQATPPTGRMVIHLSKDVKQWANTSADVPVRAGDSLFIPKVPNSVVVSGAVYNPTAVTFKPGKSAGWYLQQAGGVSTQGNKKAVFVVRADGSVIGGNGGMFSAGVEGAELRAGDMVVVPDKAFSASSRWKNILQGAQLAYAVGIAIQVARGF